MRVEVAPGLARCSRASQHRYRLEEAEAFVAPIIREQELAAPDRPVVAPSEAVKDDAQRRRSVEGIAVFREARGEWA
jgi:hypothetical protein